MGALVVSGATVYAGGTFAMAGGQSRAGLAAIDAATGAVTSWNANLTRSDPFQPEVRTLALGGTTLYVGGSFSSILGQNRGGLVAIDTATGGLTGWTPPSGLSADVLVARDAAVYIAGQFFGLVGGQPRNRLAALDATSGALLPWNPDANNTVTTLVVSGTTAYVGGAFTTVGGQGRLHLAAIDTTSGGVTPWNPQANSDVTALAAYGNVVYAGGGFSAAGVGLPTRNYLAALDATNGSATAWDPFPNGATTINTLLAVDGTIYVGGAFTVMGTLPQARFAAIAADPHVAAPSAVTSAARAISATGATLAGLVSTNGHATTAGFQLTTTSGDYRAARTIAATPSPIAGIGPVVISATVDLLAPRTTYYYRVAAANDLGTSYGGEQQFATLAYNIFLPDIRATP